VTKRAPRLAVLQTTLKETAAELIARQHKGVADREAISAAEIQLASTRADVERLTSEAKTLGDRLRAAETYNRQAFERDQKTAETWERQFEDQRAEQLRQQELAELELRRARQASEEQKAEALRLGGTRSSVPGKPKQPPRSKSPRCVSNANAAKPSQTP